MFLKETFLKNRTILYNSNVYSIRLYIIIVFHFKLHQVIFIKQTKKSATEASWVEIFAAETSNYPLSSSILDV